MNNIFHLARAEGCSLWHYESVHQIWQRAHVSKIMNIFWAVAQCMLCFSYRSVGNAITSIISTFLTAHQLGN